jgi:hypothetical protein
MNVACVQTQCIASLHGRRLRTDAQFWRPTYGAGSSLRRAGAKEVVYIIILCGLVVWNSKQNRTFTQFLLWDVF